MGDDSFEFRSYCRECKEERPVVMKRWLYEALRTETDIKVISAGCSHTWSLSAEEKRNLRKKLRDERMRRTESQSEKR
jgi:hypothetical protein